MPTIQHNVLTGSEIHEPKGVDTANAGDIYVADGAGSGSWMNPPWGWGYYQDAGSAQVFNTTPAKLSIDGAGTLTNEDFLPNEIRGSASLWDTTNDKMTPVRVGDAYDLRLDLPVTAETGSPTDITIQLDIGGTSSPTIVILERYVTAGRSVPYTITMGLPILALTSVTVANGIQLFISTDTGTVTITNPSITLVKNMDGLL